MREVVFSSFPMRVCDIILCLKNSGPEIVQTLADKVSHTHSLCPNRRAALSIIDRNYDVD
ncbi:hypothetical protein J6590_024043 [Homalodisca vitripennis]|nr:hypothetical protein J6590_024043 [Homalodisca vitripennis]